MLARFVLAAMASLIVLSVALTTAAPILAQSGAGTGLQAAPTAAPTAAPRKRLEAPPLRPRAAALLIGSNLLLAVGVVALAFYLRRRQRTP